jgi:arylsulfatase A-like enzyme
MSSPQLPGNEPKLRSALLSLWLRLITLAIFGLLFAEGLDLASGKIQGWSFYLTPLEVIFEVAVRLIFTALVGIALGTVCSAVIAPLIWHFKESRERLTEWVIRIAVVLVVFLSSKLALMALIKWSYQLSDHRGIFDTVVRSAFYIAFAVALYFSASRRALVTSLDGFLGQKFVRRVAMGTVASAVALVILEFALVRMTSPIEGSIVSQRPKSNVLLITFDALTAEDMSLYGYGLPTTPNIDAFARTATVFRNFYSGSSFTTPCMATMITGMYPSQTRVHQLHGKLNDPEKTLPHVMRAGGYATASFFSNPSAHYLAQGIRSEYDFLPDPVFQPGAPQYIWNATALLHQPSRFGNRIDEYSDLVAVWDHLSGLPTNSHEGLRAAESFEHAQELLAKLPNGFFLWIHVMTPHAPYLPDSQDRGRFLPPTVQQFFEGENEPKWTPHYKLADQGRVDEYRRRYNEFLLTADRAFGAFMSDFERRTQFQNTTIIVSADHGESFEGGMYQHGGPHLTRPVIHVPLIIKTPGQQQGREVAVIADETALAPTIVELAGLQKPDWMHGQSLLQWLNHDQEDSQEGLAFTQYFEKNSIFEPLRHGSVGVIDGQYQYVLDLDTKKGALRPLNEAHIWNLDRSAENPAKAEELLAAIYSRFPEVRQDSK